MFECSICRDDTNDVVKINGNRFHNDDFCLKILVRHYKELIEFLEKCQVDNKAKSVEAIENEIKRLNEHNKSRYFGKLADEEIKELAIKKFNLGMEQGEMRLNDNKKTLSALKKYIENKMR